MDEKIKKPIYKRWWFIVGIVLIIVIGAGGAMGGGDDKTPSGDNNNTAEETADEAAKTPTAVTVDQLMTALDENALNAAQTYEGMYVELTGELSVIDASGDYFSLIPANDDWAFIGVQCYISEEQVSQVSTFTDGQSVTVIGTITDVGEILGYSLDVESIK